MTGAAVARTVAIILALGALLMLGRRGGYTRRPGASPPEPDDIVPMTAWDEADGMCPRCVTPWRCNGPHEIEETPWYRRSRMEATA